MNQILNNQRVYPTVKAKGPEEPEPEGEGKTTRRLILFSSVPRDPYIPNAGTNRPHPHTYRRKSCDSNHGIMQAYESASGVNGQPTDSIESTVQIRLVARS